MDIKVFLLLLILLKKKRTPQKKTELKQSALILAFWFLSQMFFSPKSYGIWGYKID